MPRPGPKRGREGGALARLPCPQPEVCQGGGPSVGKRGGGPNGWGVGGGVGVGGDGGGGGRWGMVWGHASARPMGPMGRLHTQPAGVAQWHRWVGNSPRPLGPAHWGLRAACHPMGRWMYPPRPMGGSASTSGPAHGKVDPTHWGQWLAMRSPQPALCHGYSGLPTTGSAIQCAHWGQR